MMEKKRWIGIVICGGILTVFCSIAVWGDLGQYYIYWKYSAFLPHEELIIIFFSLMLATILYIVVNVIGLLRKKKWARIGAIIGALVIIVLASYCIIVDVIIGVKYNMIKIYLDAILRDIFSLLFNLFIIFFFTRPKVKEQFR